MIFFKIFTNLCKIEFFSCQYRQVNTKAYEYFGGSERLLFKRKHIRQRLMMMMTNEAARCLEEGILQSPKDGDIGAIFGLGYPAFTGGPFRYIDSLGANQIHKRLTQLSDKYGNRFNPAPIITSYATLGKKFYA